MGVAAAAMIPATWVPCSQPFPHRQGTAAPGPVMVDWPLGQEALLKQAS